MTELLALIEYLIDFLELILLNRHELSQDFGSYHESDYWFNSGALR